MIKVYESGKVTSKGQMLIPVEIRRDLGIAKDDKILFLMDDNGEVKIQVSKKKSLLDVVGILKTDQEYDFQEAREAAQGFVGESYSKGDTK